MVIAGKRLPRRPKERARVVQKQLDVNFSFLYFLLFIS